MNQQEITQLIKREVIPAMGCTEPVAVALAVAKAVETLGCPREDITRIECRLSPNIMKNAMGVGIPGTGMIGLPIAVALGALIGDSSLELEVLSAVTPEAVAAGRALIDKGIIDIDLYPNPPAVLHIDVTVYAGSGGFSPRNTDAACTKARAVISENHTNFTLVEKNGEALAGSGGFSPHSDSTAIDAHARAKAPAPGATQPTTNNQQPSPLTFAEVWDYAMNTPLDELMFILETRRLNKAAAEWALMDSYGHQVGRILHSERQRAVMGDSTFSRILSYTSAACDARMGGAPVAVMSNSGSGNQGIAATMPVVIYAEENYADLEHTVRALVLSHLTVIYIKQSLGRLSALCGCVVAATGSAAGVCYLMGGDYHRVSGAIKNMVANITGMICDGAKPGCALKVTSGVSTAVISAMMAMEGHTASSLEGIIDDDVDRTVHNLTTIGREGMTHTDSLILKIMTTK